MGEPRWLTMQYMFCDPKFCDMTANVRQKATSGMGQSRRFGRTPAYFRSTPVNGHSQDRRACLKGAMNRPWLSSNPDIILGCTFAALMARIRRAAFPLNDH
jgi:hypothetical protein